MHQRFVKFYCKVFIGLFLMLTPSFVSVQVQAQNSNVEIAQFDNPSDADGKKDKKGKDKDKDKDEQVTINVGFFISFAANLFTLLVLIGFLYYSNYKKKDLVFTYVIFNVIIFLLTFVFNQVKISMGAAFGMFAIFSMLRYRTEGISAKDMTYLFIVIATGLINAIQLDYPVLLFFNGSIILITFVLDGNILFKRQQTKIVLYDKIDLIKPEKEAELLLDLKQRTGLDITKISINKIDFLRDVAVIEIYYN